MRNELDLRGLDEIFADAENVDREIEEKKIDFKTDIDYNDALDALKKNIYNANQLLEKIQYEMNNGNFSARLAEVASTIINSVTQASKEILSDQNYEDYMEVRRQIVLLKEKELDIKKAKFRGPTNQTNILVTSREDLLKALENKQPKQLN
jgi:hypothetical protein